MRYLRDLFLNPPQGGNVRGLPTAPSMGALPAPSCVSPKAWTDSGAGLEDQREARTLARMSDEQRLEYENKERMARRLSPKTGPLAQTSLRESFEAGELGARRRVQQAGALEQPEMRNYTRGRIPPQTTTDPSAVNTFDMEAELSGDPHGVVEGVRVTANNGARPRMALQPPVPPTRDGKGM